MRKTIAAGVTVLVLMLTGCGSPAGQTATYDDTPSQEVTIEQGVDLSDSNPDLSIITVDGVECAVIYSSLGAALDCNWDGAVR
jgi:uncharacterized protein YcfL